MNIYYIDFENVSNQGLKGIELLSSADEVNLLYSKKAETIKIDTLTQLMASSANIHFLPVHVGTPNALDFQLITLLFLHYTEGNNYYIISKDSGYDCCIKTAVENGAPNVSRYPNIESAVNGKQQNKTQRSRRGSGRGRGEKSAEDNTSSAQEQVAAAQVQSGSSQMQNAAMSVQSPDQIPVQSQDSGSISSDVSAKELNPQSAEAASTLAALQEDAFRQDPDNTSAGNASTDGQVDTVAGDGTAQEEASSKKRSSRRRGRRKSSAASQEAADTTDTTDNSENRTAEQPAENAVSSDSSQKEAFDADEKQNQPQRGQRSSRGRNQKQPQNQRQQAAKEETPAQTQTQKQSQNQKQSQPQRQQNARAEADRSDKPVTILSVIRRRNDVQLDLNQIDMIRDALKTTSNKQQFYNYFAKKLGQKKGMELYHSIKSSYTDLINANLI